MLRYTEKQGGITFNARIQPRAAKNQISGVHDGALKIRFAAPPQIRLTMRRDFWRQGRAARNYGW